MEFIHSAEHFFPYSPKLTGSNKESETPVIDNDVKRNVSMAAAQLLIQPHLDLNEERITIFSPFNNQKYVLNPAQACELSKAFKEYENDREAEKLFQWDFEQYLKLE